MAIRKKSRPSGSGSSGSGVTSRGGVEDRQPFGRTGSQSGYVPGYDAGFDFNYDGMYGPFSANNPENIWWANAEGANTGRMFGALLGSLSQGGNYGQNLTDIFKLISDLYSRGASVDPNVITSLLTSALGYASTLDQRKYDWSLTQDSRVYNSPTNELARLMGAGISRDAALQIMSGGATAGAGVGSSGVASPVASPVAGAGAAALNSSNAHANLMNNIYGGINTGLNVLSTLTQAGLSVAEAVPQIQMLQAQQYMSQAQLGAFQDVEQVTQMIQSLQNTGMLDKTDLDKISNGNDLVDYLKKVAPDNDWVNHLVKSRPYQNMLGSQFGRQRFNDWWKSMRDTRDAGTIYDEFVHQQRLKTLLDGINYDTAYLDYYKAFSSFDYEMEMFEQELANGNISIKINGQVLSQEELRTKIMQYSENQAETYNDIFNKTYNDDTDNQGHSRMPGKYLMSQIQYYELLDALERQKVMFNSEDSLALYRDMLDKNFKAAWNAAMIRWYASNNIQMAWNVDANPNLSTMMSFFNLLNASGIYNFIDVVNNTTNTGANLFRSLNNNSVAGTVRGAVVNGILHKTLK